MWSCYNYVLSDLPRSNNLIEGWHNVLMNRVGKHHVNMAGFLEVIQKEQSMSEIVMNQ